MRRNALLRDVRFERVLARLRAKAKHLRDVRLLEVRRNHDTEIEIKKMEHKKMDVGSGSQTMEKKG